MNTPKSVLDALREKGFEYTAQYIERFGWDALDPGRWRGFNEQTEEFYRKCVITGKPYTYFCEYEDGALF